MRVYYYFSYIANGQFGSGCVDTDGLSFPMVHVLTELKKKIKDEKNPTVIFFDKISKEETLRLESFLQENPSGVE